MGKPACILILLLLSNSVPAQTLSAWIDENCAVCVERMASSTGVHVLEKGEEALIGRAWLTQAASKSIDVQYFIWSADNVGKLAAEFLLSASERGVSVRVLIDDLLVDTDDRTLLLLSNHANVQIRIYNPNITVGVSFWARIRNALTGFRDVNQRMHDKTAIFDGLAGITGGRNMADEYFDFDHVFNFRDRDVLLLGKAVRDMSENFEEFWNSELAVPVELLLEEEARKISATEAQQRAIDLHAYARDPDNFEPEVRTAIDSAPRSFPPLLKTMVWADAQFLSDTPGKNSGEAGLGGGGEATNQLINAVKNAQHSVLIQSPYLIVPEGGIELFEALSHKGVRVRISTNSLASTDNIQAFSGYQRQREALLKAGVEIFEFMPEPNSHRKLLERYHRIAANNPVFGLHAKSMIIDDEVVFVGTFNLDPRSANLNTEVGMMAVNRDLAQRVTRSIEDDMLAGNSWPVTADFNPDFTVSRIKRTRTWFYRLLPLEPVL